jgi:hypothetical protein
VLFLQAFTVFDTVQDDVSKGVMLLILQALGLAEGEFAGLAMARAGMG